MELQTPLATPRVPPIPSQLKRETSVVLNHLADSRIWREHHVVELHGARGGFCKSPLILQQVSSFPRERAVRWHHLHQLLERLSNNETLSTWHAPFEATRRDVEAVQVSIGWRH